MVAGVVFGAIHCIAWYFNFRSHSELFLWRLSSIAITAVPMLFGSSLLYAYLTETHGNDSLDFVLCLLCLPAIIFVIFGIISTILSPLLGLLYILARLTTIVLAFINLASLPPGAFQAVHWTTLLPHL